MKTRILIFSFFLIFIIVGCSNLKTQQNETNNSTNIINKNSINTNISPTNQNLDNTKIVNSLRGYLIYKTKSCAFRRIDPPYLPEAPCAPDSGYVVLSDSKDNLKTNPLDEKTILNQNQILVYSVPDSVIDKIVLGNIYEFKGSVKKANYCEIDSDCTYKPNLGFVKGCDRLFNINEDLTEIILKEKMFFDYRCQSVEISCIPHNRINLKCENNKCVSISNN